MAHQTTADTTVPDAFAPLQHMPWQGNRCRIRRFTAQDVYDLHDFAKRPSVSKHMNWAPHPSLEHSARYLQGVCAAYEREADAPWAIATLEENRAVGFVGFTHFSTDHRRSDLAIGLHPEFAGRGMAFEACQFLLEQARAVGLMRVQAVVEVDNGASQRLMQRLGMQERVLLRDYLVSKGGATDAYLYATFFADNRPPAPSQP